MAQEISAKGGSVLTGTTAESFQMEDGDIRKAVLNSNGNKNSGNGSCYFNTTS